MFDWVLFLGLVGVSIPGIVVAVPQLLNTLEKTIRNMVFEPPIYVRIQHISSILLVCWT